MGGKINKAVYTDCKGQRIYFCCKGCVAKFEKDPDKYLAQMKERGIAPAAVADKSCPMAARKCCAASGKTTPAAEKKAEDAKAETPKAE